MFTALPVKKNLEDLERYLHLVNEWKLQALYKTDIENIVFFTHLSI